MDRWARTSYGIERSLCRDVESGPGSVLHTWSVGGRQKARDSHPYRGMLSRSDLCGAVHITIDVLDQDGRIDVFTGDEEVYRLYVIVAALVRVVVFIPLLSLS
jgi:hypothetical protein